MPAPFGRFWLRCGRFWGFEVAGIGYWPRARAFLARSIRAAEAAGWWSENGFSPQAVNGYKRHIAVDADVPGLIHAVVVQAGNQREHAAVDPLMKALDAEGKKLTELHIDRGYLPADRVMASHREGIRVISKPPTPQATGLYSKEKFTPDYIKKPSRALLV